MNSLTQIGKLLAGEVLTGSVTQLRDIGHTISNVVFEQVTSVQALLPRNCSTLCPRTPALGHLSLVGEIRL